MRAQLPSVQGVLARALRIAAIASALMVTAGPAHAAPQAPANPWQSPNLLVSQDRLDEIARRIAAGDATMISARDQAVADAATRLADTPQPIHGVLKAPGFYIDPQGQRAVTQPLRRDATNAHIFAMAHALTGDPVYAAKAREFVNAWVAHCTHPQDGGRWTDIFRGGSPRGDTPLVIAYSFPHFIYAVDLLKGAGAFSPAETAAFEAWLRVFVRYHRNEELSINNHHSWQVVFLMAAGHILNDRGLFDDAVRYYRRGFRVQILGSGAMPFELVRGDKAATYSLMNLEALMQAVHLAEMHGVRDLRDMRSWGGGDLHDAVEFICEFIEDPRAWRRYVGSRTLNGPSAPGEWGWVLEPAGAWWPGNPRYTPAQHLSARSYGAQPARCYTLSFATLAFAD